MKKRVYMTPEMHVSSIFFENCIANSSIKELQIDQDNINIELSDWQNGDGFSETDVTDYN